jgi:dipeptidyl aminopeptidase/acylaminoacyl peptidase
MTPRPAAAINATPCCFTSAGETVSAVLYEPPDRRGKYPAIVLSPPRRRTIEQLEWLSRALAANDFVVLGHRYRDGDTRYQLRDVVDVRSGIDFLTSLPSVDAKRLGVVGHSRGGSASLRAAAQDGRIRAAVALGAPIDIGRYVKALRDYAPGRYQLMIKAYGAAPEEDPHYYRQISPLTYASALQAAVLLIHGTDDLITPHQHSEWMHDAVVKEGNPRCNLELIPGMGHFFEMGMQGYQFDNVAGLVGSWLSKVLS